MVKIDIELNDLSSGKSETQHCHDSVVWGFNLQQWKEILWIMFCPIM